VLNFDNADVETVIQAASEILGFNYVLAPDVRGKVTVQTAGRIKQEEVFGVLLAILEVHGFTAVRTGNLYKIVRIPDAVARAIPTIVGAVPDPTRTGDELVTQIVPVQYGNVADIRNLLQPLVSPQRGSILANRENNLLIITDTASNIRRLLDIVRLVDVEVSTEEIQIIPVQYADAAELAQILTQIFATGRIRPPATPGAPVAPIPPAAPPVPGAPVPPQVPRGVSPEPAVERPPLILAERRSNSLIVHAKRTEVEAIRRLVERLDINVTGGRRVFIYYAENAKSKDLAATMNALYGRETVPATTPTPGTLRQPAGEPQAPPRPAPISGPGARLGTTPAIGVAEVGFVEGQFRFIADETTNAVIIATTPRNWSEIEETLKQLDRSPRQVLIEVLVAEVTLTDDTRLGIEWAVRAGRFSVNNAPGIGGNPAGTIGGRQDFAIPSAGAISTLAGFNFFTFAADRFLAALNVLASENRANVLSSPSIMTSENKKAVINVSDSIPIVTSQQVPLGGAIQQQNNATAAVVGTQSVEYRDAGVILTVTPRIGERGTVALDVKQEVNDIGDPEPPTQSRRIIKREAETSVVLLNNQTLVLGGLIRDRRSRVERGIPVLHKIPLLGALFGFKEETIDKTELLILITPRVIGTALDAARITETLRNANPQVQDAFRKAPVLPPTSPGLAPPAPPVAPALPGPEAPPR
jgi:general secretion pathway protein D